MGGSWGGKEKDSYKIISQSAFDKTRGPRALKSFLMSKQVLLIMHRHTSLKLSRNQPADMWEGGARSQIKHEQFSLRGLTHFYKPKRLAG